MNNPEVTMHEDQQATRNPEMSVRCLPRRAEIRATSGCRVRHCAGTTIRHRDALRKMALTGSPGRRDAVYLPGSEEGRRRAIGVVAALSINPRSTTPMVRRWVVGTPKRHSDPEGRSRGNLEPRVAEILDFTHRPSASRSASSAARGSPRAIVRRCCSTPRTPARPRAG